MLASSECKYLTQTFKIQNDVVIDWTAMLGLVSILLSKCKIVLSQTL